MIKKRTLLVLLAVFVLIGIPLLLWAVSSSVSQNSNNTTIVDRDTGEKFNPEDNKFQTGGSINRESPIQLFGIENFSKVARESNTDTGGYLTAIKEALWNFSKERLDNKFPTLTVRPQDLKVSDTAFSGFVRIGQTDTIVQIKGTITSGRETAIVYINTDNSDYEGEYIYVGGIRNPDQYLFTISQKDSKTTDLVIDTIPGYTEPSLKYIESLGYSVPDFSISFINVKGTL